MPGIRSQLKEHEPADFRSRFQAMFVIVTVLVSILVIRIWYLQVIKGGEYRQRSESNSIRFRKIIPLRGLIMDRNGIVMVDNQPSFNLIFLPNRPQDLHKVAERLDRIYTANGMTFHTDLSLDRVAQPSVPIRLARNISREEIAVVETHALELPGVIVEPTPVRKYMQDEMIALVIGYTGEISQEDLDKDEKGELSIGDIIGKYGIERNYDNYLKGRSGAEHVEVNVSGRVTRVLGRIDPTPGYNLRLTIDSRLQKIAWDALEGRAGAVMAMDVRNGGILAMISSPSFDPNLFTKGISFDDWERLSSNPLHPMEDRAISGTYPPGSTYKIVVAAAALEMGLIKPATKFYCNGHFELGNRSYHCWQKNGHGMLDLHRAIVQSCDVYFYNLGKLVGVDALAWYARGFGFGERTGIDLPHEKGGVIPTKAWKMSRFKQPWQQGETISLAIGQGFNAVTPLQLLSAYASLANGGMRWRPRLVERIETPDGQVLKAFGPEAIGRIPVQEKNIDILNYGLWGVVNEGGGTGYVLHRKEADVCGKTGTAQVIGQVQEGSGRRRAFQGDTRDHAWFVCFAPYRHPEIAVVVIVEHGGHGGAAAAPVARKIIDAYFQPPRPEETKALALKSLTAAGSNLPASGERRP
jgi:penicillin-binding protein 2